jgi:YrbI family 3-deoxy-D-manno-octulosonate 8-phosphate phosphatase
MGSGTKQVTVFIPARGGSKSIPLKNLAPLAGRPLLYWVARACSDSARVREIFIASDSAEIRECVDSLRLPRVQAIDRSVSGATDTASSEAPLLEFAETHPADHIALVQATSPLLTAQHVTEAVEKYFASGADSLVTLVRTKRFLWEEKDDLVLPVNYDPARRPRRQEWGGQLVENGAIYITSRERLLATRCRLSGRIAVYLMPEETYFEIDEPSDWAIVENLLIANQRQGPALASVAGKLKLLCIDVDGTLTDGGMYYTDAGETMKRFNTRDAMGMSRLRKRGIALAIVTAEDSQIVQARARKIGVEHVYIGISDKRALLEELLGKLGLTWEQVAYVGDDLNDLEAMRAAGFSACPSDSAGEIVRHAHYVCRKAGGKGAVREVCDLIEAALESQAGGGRKSSTMAGG